TLNFDADFADIFEVRGTKRARRGQRLDDVVEGQRVTLGYQGLDGVARRSRIAFDVAPETLSGKQARFRIELAPHQTKTIHLTVVCEAGDDGRQPLANDEA